MRPKRPMRLFSGSRRLEEQLLWSRDIRFVHRLASAIHGARVLELDSGAIVIGSAAALTETATAKIASYSRLPEYGLVAVDAGLPEADRYLMALSAAVQASGLADRIGMAPTRHVIQTKMLDYFFSLRRLHAVAFQPIVELATGDLYEYECLFRPDMPMLPQSIGSIVQAAIDTDRAVELDVFLVGSILARAGELERHRREAGSTPLRLAVNLTPSSLLDSQFESATLVSTVRAAGLEPRHITIECTEQQSVADVGPLKRAVKALRRAGFGFAVDDAGAGYASFALIAALRPSVIKIDREIVTGIARDDAKQALVEAFVAFGRRIGARLLAEGIEKRVDLAMISSLGVDLGQGYLLGRPALEPGAPRPIDGLRLDATRQAARAAIAGRRFKPATTD